jgi:hypothetical protein
MIGGGRYWNDRDHFYVQTNNPTEEILRKAGGLEKFLESCMPTAAVNCNAARGKNLGVTCPGGYEPQPEEVLMDFFNDPRNYAVLRSIRQGVEKYPFNRIPQYYPYAVEQVFGITDAQYREGLSVKALRDFLMKGGTFQGCLIDPGHALAFVAYDFMYGEFIYNDSWPGRHKDGNGFNRRMNHEEYEKTMCNWTILYGI